MSACLHKNARTLYIMLQGSHSLAYKNSRTPKNFFQDWHSPAMFKSTDKQQLLTLCILCESTIHCETFITSCKLFG